MTKNEILETKWVNLGRWVQTPLGGCMWVHWHEAKSTKAIVPSLTLEQMLFLDGYTLMRETDQQAIRSAVAEMDAKGELGRFCDLFERVEVSCEQQHLAFLQRSDVDVNSYVKELLDLHLEILGAWMMALVIAAEAETYARSKNLIASDEELLARMQPHMRTTWIEEQVKDVERIASLFWALGITSVEGIAPALAAHPEITANIDEHLRVFSWYGSHHWEGEGYSREKLLADLGRLLIAPSNTSVHHTPFVTTVEAEEHADLWRLIALCSYWRTHCAELSDKILFHARPALSKLAALWQMTYDELVWLSRPEVDKAIRLGAFKVPADITLRRSGWGYYLDDRHGNLITGEELTKMISKLVLLEEVEHMREFTGVVASKGSVVRGTAKVVRGPRDFGKFHEGDILIASETTPDFVPLMKLAAAIVTEIGGITSHAAIVSRELRKPCIIGTKIATRAIKDGDTVEVDASRGIITIV